jgi:hypothetical protein
VAFNLVWASSISDSENLPVTEHFAESSLNSFSPVREKNSHISFEEGKTRVVFFIS